MTWLIAVLLALSILTNVAAITVTRMARAGIRQCVDASRVANACAKEAARQADRAADITRRLEDQWLA